MCIKMYFMRFAPHPGDLVASRDSQILKRSKNYSKDIWLALKKRMSVSTLQHTGLIWFVRSTPDRAVWVETLCCVLGQDTLTAPLSTQVYERQWINAEGYPALD